MPKRRNQEAQRETRHIENLKAFPDQARVFDDLSPDDSQKLSEDIRENGLKEAIQILPQNAAYRLHGSPHMYYSDYSSSSLDALTERLSAAAARSVTVWCIFDNTAAGAATVNALSVLDRLRARPGMITVPHCARVRQAGS